MARFPQLNPLVYSEAVCSQCGAVMAREIKRGPMSRVEKIIYRCENEQSGCSYQVESDVRLPGMAQPVTRDAHA